MYIYIYIYIFIQISKCCLVSANLHWSSSSPRFFQFKCMIVEQMVHVNTPMTNKSLSSPHHLKCLVSHPLSNGIPSRPFIIGGCKIGTPSTNQSGLFGASNRSCWRINPNHVDGIQCSLHHLIRTALQTRLRPPPPPPPPPRCLWNDSCNLALNVSLCLIISPHCPRTKCCMSRVILVWKNICVSFSFCVYSLDFMLPLPLLVAFVSSTSKGPSSLSILY